MKKSLLLAALSLSVVMPAMAGNVAQDMEKKEMDGGVVAASDMVLEQPKWGYFGSLGAARWGGLDPAYTACGEGQAQSPININKFKRAGLPALAFGYGERPLTVLNTGYGVRLDASGAGVFSAGDADYRLHHVSFHTPSEHYIDGAPYPMEAQFEHVSDTGGLAIVSVMLKIGAHNPVVEGIWQNVPKAGMQKVVEGVVVNPADLLPEALGYYAYEGSLSVPPCSEGVKRYVMKTPIELSEKQLRAFQSVFAVNARPVQPINGREV
ncbi:MAG: carbonic anhydrase, partial [Alphaproteobacteria bacterium]